MKNQGQLSLEYLILLATFFSILLLFIPLINQTYYLGLFSLDISEGKNFLNSFKGTVNEMNLLENGTKKIIKFDSILEWKIYFKNQEIHLLIESIELQKSKELTAFVGDNVILQGFNSIGKQEIVLRKENNLILVEYSQSKIT